MLLYILLPNFWQKYEEPVKRPNEYTKFSLIECVFRSYGCMKFPMVVENFSIGRENLPTMWHNWSPTHSGLQLRNIHPCLKHLRQPKRGALLPREIFHALARSCRRIISQHWAAAWSQASGKRHDSSALLLTSLLASPAFPPGFWWNFFSPVDGCVPFEPSFSLFPFPYRLPPIFKPESI